jgi:hypothetical protein
MSHRLLPSLSPRRTNSGAVQLGRIAANMKEHGFTEAEFTGIGFAEAGFAES